MAEEGKKNEEEVHTNVSVKSSIFRERYCSIVVLFVFVFWFEMACSTASSSASVCIVYTVLVSSKLVGRELHRFLCLDACGVVSPSPIVHTECTPLSRFLCPTGVQSASVSSGPKAALLYNYCCTINSSIY